MKKVAAIAIICFLSLIEGCATAYVANLRSEYSDKGEIYGVYHGDDEYPCIYPATRISLLVEVPTWWWPSETEIGRGYEAWLWPIGAPLSIVDVVCSIATDTIMLPYDYHNRKPEEDLESSVRHRNLPGEKK